MPQHNAVVRKKTMVWKEIYSLRDLKMVIMRRDLHQFLLPLLLFFIILSVTGCTRTLFGMPEDQFNQLNDQQKQQVIAGYNQQQLIKTQNAPLIDAIGTAGKLLNMNKEVPLSNSSTSSCHFEGNTQVCNSSGSSSSIHFGFQ